MGHDVEVPEHDELQVPPFLDGFPDAPVVEVEVLAQRAEVERELVLVRLEPLALCDEGIIQDGLEQLPVRSHDGGADDRTRVPRRDCCDTLQPTTAQRRGV